MDDGTYVVAKEKYFENGGATYRWVVVLKVGNEAIRLVTVEELDELIGALVRMRHNVWPWPPFDLG